MEGEKKTYDAKMDKKISDAEKKRDLEVAGQMQRIFAKHHLSASEMIKLKYADKRYDHSSQKCEGRTGRAGQAHLG